MFAAHECVLVDFLDTIKDDNISDSGSLKRLRANGGYCQLPPFHLNSGRNEEVLVRLINKSDFLSIFLGNAKYSFCSHRFSKLLSSFAEDTLCTLFFFSRHGGGAKNLFPPF